jgi:hypothetical protein
VQHSDTIGRPPTEATAKPAARGKPNPERPRLQAAWLQRFGTPPPAFLSVAFMTDALDFERQCKENGRPPAATRRALAQIAEGKSVKAINVSSAKAGALLVREWNGRTYQVEVVKDGFVLDGKTWQSLSAIAKHITGTIWSGPRFFGLTKVGAGRAS